MSFPEDPEELTDDELWQIVATGVGDADTVRAYIRKDYSDAANIQERAAQLFIDRGSPKDAVMAFARATESWMEAEEWQCIEDIAEKIETVGETVFEADVWRNYYSAYAWAAHYRRATVVALDYIARALACARELGSNFHLALHLWQKGSILASMGRTREALTILSEGRDAAREAEHLPVLSDILAEMSLAEALLLNQDRAVELAEEASMLMGEYFPFPALRHRVQFAVANAHLVNADFDMATVGFMENLDELPNYLKIRSMIKLTESDPAQSEQWEKRAYTLAKNTNAWDLLNHLETNRAMAAAPEQAIALLESVLARALEYDDDCSRDQARIVMARKLLDSDRAAEALELLDIMSIANFGDDMHRTITYLVLRTDALIATGNLVEARNTASVLTHLDPRWGFVSGITEGYWQLSQIELASNGPTPEWERLANSSIAYAARGFDYTVVAQRTDVLRGIAPSLSHSYREPIITVEELIKDIERESGQIA